MFEGSIFAFSRFDFGNIWCTQIVIFISIQKVHDFSISLFKEDVMKVIINRSTTVCMTAVNLSTTN